MNNRVRELIKLHGSDSSGKWVAVDKVELIAEMIVQECSSKVDSILRQNQVEYIATGGGTMGDVIREHFGVKE
jgi:hypothetical protein